MQIQMQIQIQMQMQMQIPLQSPPGWQLGTVENIYSWQLLHVVVHEICLLALASLVDPIHCTVYSV